MSPLTWLRYLTEHDKKNKLVWSCLMKTTCFMFSKNWNILELKSSNPWHDWLPPGPGGIRNVSITRQPGADSHQAYHAECLPRYFPLCTWSLQGARARKYKLILRQHWIARLKTVDITLLCYSLVNGRTVRHNTESPDTALIGCWRDIVIIRSYLHRTETSPVHWHSYVDIW